MNKAPVAPGQNAESIQTVGDLLTIVSDRLASAHVPEPGREASDIVSALLDVPRFWPAANTQSAAPTELVESATRAAEKRRAGAPLAYAVGRASFRHLTLEVDESVLIPRVETEMLVERLLERCTPDTRTVADIGTGSGAIALSMAFERDLECVIGTDISLGALAVAGKNLRALRNVLRSPVEFFSGALFAPLAGRRIDAIVSNPPYIAYSEGGALPPSVRDWEPAIALLCADEGLAVTRSIVAQAPDFLARGGILALEVDARRAGLVAEMVAVDGRYVEIEVLLDLTGRERFVFGRRN